MGILKEPKTYTNCRYCDSIVYSDTPTCKKCGLQMSSDGIMDLHEIESNQINEIDALDKAKTVSFFAPFYTLFGFVFYMGSGLTIFFHFCFWILSFFMFVGVIGWTAKNADLDLSIEELSIVKKNKMTIWLMLGINLALGLALNAYILS